MPTTSVVQILTASIAPVIVIPGNGLLLLSITNRYGRAIDRARLIMRELQSRDCQQHRRPSFRGKFGCPRSRGFRDLGFSTMSHCAQRQLDAR